MHESGLDAGNTGSMPSRKMIVNDLKSRVERRQYHVDCAAVAEAFLARQTECWNPDSDRSPDRSRRASPGGPSTTRPMRVIDLRVSGPHAQSS